MKPRINLSKYVIMWVLKPRIKDKYGLMGSAFDIEGSGTIDGLYRAVTGD